MKFTKVKGLVLIPILAMALAGCGGKKPSPSSVEKQEVSISIALEDGKQFNENEFVAPQVSVVPSSITPTITYYSGETSLGDAAPQTVGDYTITVTTAETSEYYAGLASKSFLIRKVPTLSFYYGNDQALEANHKFDLAQGDYNVYAKSSVEGAEILYTYMTADGSKLVGKPNQVGVYYLLAEVVRTSTIGSTSASIGFELIDSAAGVAVDPVIKFFYNGEEACLESNWLVGGFAQSHFNASDFDITKLTYTINPANAEHTTAWTLKALDAPEEADGSPIDKPSNPLAPGIYTLTVSVTQTATVNAKAKWAGFVINDNGQGGGGEGGKTDPVIKFFYNGEEACLESNWIIGGFAQSHFNASDFDVTKLTFTVTPNTASYSTAWSLKALDAPEEAEGSPINKPSNPLAPGIYTITVSVAESETVNAKAKWAGFVINDTGSQGKVDPVIKFFYDGQEKCISGSRWLNEGYGDTQFFDNEFDIAKLTYTVTPNAAATVSWTLDEVAHDAPTNPLAAGTWAMTVSVAATDTVNAGSAYALFHIKESAPVKVDPVIKFFYDGQEKCISGSHWLNEGYGDTQFFDNEFDIAKLTYTVTPTLASTVSWTLNEVDHAAPSNPLAAGTWAMTVNVAAGDGNNAAVNWALFHIKESAPAKVDPVIKFFYDGQEKCISGSRWLNEGYGDTQFFDNEFDIAKLTYTVTPTAAATVSWTLDEVAHDAPTNPLAAGTWAMTVTVAGSDTVNAGSAYALFHIKQSAKVDPVIKFFYDGQEVCVSGSRWFYEGWSDSKFAAADFDINKLTYTVTPNAEAVVTWTLDEVACAAPTANPLAAGTYAMTVIVTESATVNAGVQWALFMIV